MRIQLLSDLHLETEAWQPEPAAGAQLLVLAGDIDSTWDGLAHFRDWPVPVLMVAGNHEFDGREMSDTWAELRTRCDTLGIRLIERERVVLGDTDGRRIRFVGTTRWCDFDLFGDAQRERVLRAATYLMKIQGSTLHGLPFDTTAVRLEALACRRWLAAELAATGDWDLTVAITHFGPSFLSADPRYGAQPGTASFCNADDDLLPLAALWIHGHLHCRHDYRVRHEGGETRVVCNARGHGKRREPEGFDGRFCVDV